MLVAPPANGALPARSVRDVPTVITLVVSVMSSVGVNVPVQVTPPSLLLTAVSRPFSSVISVLSKPVTASLNVMVKVEVSPTFNAVSSITTLETTGGVSSTGVTDKLKVCANGLDPSSSPSSTDTWNDAEVVSESL